jgi:hypothetical protein
VHVFPEGRIHRCADATTRPMKWGVAHLYVSAAESGAKAVRKPIAMHATCNMHATCSISLQRATCSAQHTARDVPLNVARLRHDGLTLQPLLVPIYHRGMERIMPAHTGAPKVVWSA